MGLLNMLKKRSVPAIVILTIVTCGIYGLYWSWCAIKELHEAGKSSNMAPLAQFLLFFVYVGGIIFGINANENLNAIRRAKGVPEKDNKVLYIVLYIFLPIVAMALIQKEMNELAE